MNRERINTPFGFASTAADVIREVDLAGKRVIVTGGASGIGIETARALAGAGAEVTLAVRRVDAGEKVAAEIRAALKEMGIGPRELLRRRGSPYDDLGLGKPKWTDAELVAAMAKHPLLIERPVVRTRKGTRLCRPSERLKDIL